MILRNRLKLRAFARKDDQKHPHWMTRITQKNRRDRKKRNRSPQIYADERREGKQNQKPKTESDPNGRGLDADWREIAVIADDRVIGKTSGTLGR